MEVWGGKRERASWRRLEWKRSLLLGTFVIRNLQIQTLRFSITTTISLMIPPLSVPGVLSTSLFYSVLTSLGTKFLYSPACHPGRWYTIACDLWNFTAWIFSPGHWVKPRVVNSLKISSIFLLEISFGLLGSVVFCRCAKQVFNNAKYAATVGLGSACTWKNQSGSLHLPALVLQLNKDQPVLLSKS